MGTQHVIEEEDLEALFEDRELHVPAHWGWDRLPDRRAMPNVVRIVRRQRPTHTSRQATQGVVGYYYT